MDWSWFLAPVERLPEPAELDGWFAQAQARCIGCDTLTSAMRGGRLAATPGLAFLAGYQAALRRLWPSAPPGLGALCATEQRSLRPADMQTRFTEGGISGAKDYVTAGPAAGWLLVAARDEAPGHSPRLSLYLVETGAAGVTLEPGAPLSLVPDIPHARLRLDHAPAKVLEGDCWDDFIKPFRTLEDLHVLAALVSWLHGLALECRWPQELQLRLLGLLPAAAEVATLSPSAPATYLLLAGIQAQFEALQPRLDAALASGPPHWARLWQRDRRILDLARAAQARRLAQAVAAFGAPED